MSGVRNVHFEHARALGSLHSKPFGGLNTNSQGENFLMAAAAYYAMGMPGAAQIQKGFQRLLRLDFKDASQWAAFGLTVYLLMKK